MKNMTDTIGMTRISPIQLVSFVQIAFPFKHMQDFLTGPPFHRKQVSLLPCKVSGSSRGAQKGEPMVHMGPCLLKREIERIEDVVCPVLTKSRWGQNNSGLSNLTFCSNKLMEERGYLYIYHPILQRPSTSTMEFEMMHSKTTSTTTTTFYKLFKPSCLCIVLHTSV